MAFKIGNKSGGGRPSGSRNKVTSSIKESYIKLVENNIDQLDADLKSLAARDRIKAIIELSKFIIPTIKQVDIDAEVASKGNLSWLDSFTESELEKLLKR